MVMCDSTEGWLDTICRGCGCMNAPEDMATEFYCVHCAPDPAEDVGHGE